MSALFARRPPSIRLLRPADAGAVSVLHGEAFRRGWSASDVEAMLLDGAVLGQAVRRPSRWPAGALRRADAFDGFVLSRRALDEAEILTIAVAGRAQGAGLARTLLQDHMGRLAGRGTRTLFLEVDESNAPARRLYDRCGFVEVGRRNAYYRRDDGTTATALVLSRTLG